MPQFDFYKATDKRAVPDCVMQAGDENKYLLSSAFICAQKELFLN
jgi:hypothetical protein